MYRNTETRYIATPWSHVRMSTMAGYSGTPLPRKLGITAGTWVLLDGSPRGFSLGELPDDVSVARRAGAGPYDVVVCFCPSAARLFSRWPVLHPLTTSAGALWVAWPKKSSGVATDLDEHVVRAYALSHGRVDVKVCAIDDVWTAFKHVIRKADR
jgi:hypothetical protein